MGLPVAWLSAVLDPLLRPWGTPGQAILLGACVSLGGGLYALASLLFRSDELLMLLRFARR
jgi:hypothetical protein